MSTTGARCEILGLLEEVSGSKSEGQDGLSCELCFHTKAEIFQVIGNYFLPCWQQETHPDVMIGRRE